MNNKEKNIDPSMKEDDMQKEETLSLRLTNAESLTPYQQEYFISDVKNGEDIHIGWNYYIRADFSNFDEKLEYVNSEALERLFEEVGELKKEAPNLDKETRRLLHACWRTTRITRHFLGDVSSARMRNKSFDKYEGINNKEVKMCIKPLSECLNEAVCSEYCLLSHYILKKLGIKSSIVIGAFSEENKEPPASMHTYLVLENGEYVFDPTYTASQEESWPPKVFITEFPFTANSLKDMETDPKKPFGKKAFCTDLLTNERKVYGSGA